jgi:hypothetical protein
VELRGGWASETVAGAPLAAVACGQVGGGCGGRAELECGGGSNLVLFSFLSPVIFATGLDATVLVKNLIVVTGDREVALPLNVTLVGNEIYDNMLVM